MATRKLLGVAIPLVGAACALVWASGSEAAVYNGNGGTGFGGPVGDGSLTITDDDAGNVTFNFKPVSGGTLEANDLVIYLSTTNGTSGLQNTSTLTDVGDTGREAISGYNDGTTPTSAPTGSPSRSLVTFASGFKATYALSLENAYFGIFQLPTDGSGGLTYLTGAAPPNAPSSVSFTTPLSTFGLTQGQSFEFVGTLIDGRAAYRSTEAIGATNPDVTTESNGFTTPVTFSSFDTYQSTAVPEPASLGALSLGGVLAIRRKRWNSLVEGANR